MAKLRSHLALFSQFFPFVLEAWQSYQSLLLQVKITATGLERKKNKSQVHPEMKNVRVKIKWWEDATKNSSTEWSLGPASVLPHALGTSPVIIWEWKKAMSNSWDCKEKVWFWALCHQRVWSREMSIYFVTCTGKYYFSFLFSFF